jgi:DNA-nicking Smr family endonuclease
MNQPTDPKLPYQEAVTPLNVKAREPLQPKRVKIAPPRPIYRAPEDGPCNSLVAMPVRALAKLHQRQLTGLYFPDRLTLDMHGMRLAEAEQALKQFLGRMYHQQERYVLVVTGQGQRSAPGAMTLKVALIDWVNQSSMRGYVTSLVQALPEHGGDGAYYLVLAT